MTTEHFFKEFNARMSEFDKFMGEMRAESAARREALAKLEDRMDEVSDKLEENAKTVNQLDNKITRWEGKFGGFILVFSCLVAFFGAFKEQILALIKG